MPTSRIKKVARKIFEEIGSSLESGERISVSPNGTGIHIALASKENPRPELIKALEAARDKIAPGVSFTITTLHKDYKFKSEKH